MHDFQADLVASLQLAVSEPAIDALEKCADFKEKLQSVLFVLDIAIVVHFAYKFRLYPLEVITQDVV